jgi:Cdc6-like AAA superfamily ATPase
MIGDIRNVYPRFTQIIGDTGTGKTCTTIKFSEQIAEYAENEGVTLKCVYINCKVDGATRYVLFGNLVKKITPKISTRSLSPEESIRQLVDYLNAEGIFLLATFDEIDYFVQTNPKEHIIYDLTRTTEMSPGEPSPIIGAMFIGRSLKWHERLEPGERSTLGMGMIEFPRYAGRTITSEDIMNLDENGRMVLLALIRSLRTNKSAYVGLRNIRESYEVVCEEFNAKPAEFEEYVQDLAYRSIIDMKSLTELGISGASLIDLEKFLNNLTERLRRELNED